MAIDMHNAHAVKPASPVDRRIVVALVMALLFQTGVLISEWGIAHYPLWTGEEIRLRVQPLDPRDLFRGNYARLGYDISLLPMELADQLFSESDVVYVVLEQDAAHDESSDATARDWHAVAIRAEPPVDGVFLRARVDYVDADFHRVEDVMESVVEGMQPVSSARKPRWTQGNYALRYGIEAFFAPREKAMKLEQQLRGAEAWAVVRVASSGRTALADVEVVESEVREPR